ncbi:major facilitator superfamily domain-containing protein [Suillus fuscotomentosus]|uniref:Major facilitator superfamily domain-containing protein n=1 Tax=Suillus fuscotomentosus TaxID=1912939 RepID=A0AAD4HEW7_9AGAM|nr:major facilitator superfamily domain-containing protein [Suillus fuscotomentosus]KAG1894058.1 major facilitator superfamily domain-containing protein [Suillus fuscotomentosus]
MMRVILPLQPLSQAETPVHHELSLTRKLVLLFMFCPAQFLDAFSNSALFSAIPVLEVSMGMTESQSTWIMSAFQLTFASFLLVSGRISDVYNPKTGFVGGVFGLGVISLCAGFVDDTIPLIILRALTGIALGLMIGATFVQWASYHWAFWFVCALIIPPEIAKAKDNLEPAATKWKTSMYVIRDTSTYHRSSADLVPDHRFYPNFSIIFAVALLPFFWWFTVFVIFTVLWQNVFEWSAISSAVHMLPIGVASFIMSFTGSLSRIFSPKCIILTGVSFCMIATVLLALGGGKPIGHMERRVMLTYAYANVAIFQVAPSSMAGTVGAIFNGALQFGSAIGLAVASSIETSVEAIHGGSHEYKGRAAVFWFLLTVASILTDHAPQPEHGDPRHPARRSTDCDEKLDDANVTMIEKADLANLQGPATYLTMHRISNLTPNLTGLDTVWMKTGDRDWLMLWIHTGCLIQNTNPQTFSAESVRFLDNFSAGTRGATSAEYFLKAGYAVIFMHR